MVDRNNLIQLVARQLSRKPSIGFSIAKKCRFGWPAVLFCDPVTPAGDPNPNLYYLSCHYLRRRLAQLEDAGLIRSLQAAIKADRDLAISLKHAQGQHGRQWLRLAESYRGPGLKATPAENAFREIAAPNIAASRQDTLIKCLHAHMAWFLVHPDYRLGSIIATEVGEVWCPDEACERLMTECPESP